jgi:uncharacterized protein YcaQ
VKLTKVSLAEARRIAVRAQLLDGSATSVLDTVRGLGFLQIDPISTVAPPQYLVLWSRLGPFERDELDRLLWEERKLVEWNAFIYPIESLPLIQARIRRHRSATKHGHDRWRQEFLKKNAAFRRYVLRELEQRGPLLSREIEDRSQESRLEHRWYGNRYVGLMLATLHIHGEIAVVGRRSGQRLWGLADQWYPATETVPLREAERLLAEQRFRALGVKLERGRLVVHPEVNDGPVGTRVTFLSPFDRLVHDRDRAEALWDFFYRLEMYVPKVKRVHGYYVLPILRGDRLIGRIEPIFDRKAGALRVNGVFAEPGAPASAGHGIARAIRRLAKWLGASEVSYSRRVPAIWRDSLRN